MSFPFNRNSRVFDARFLAVAATALLIAFAPFALPPASAAEAKKKVTVCLMPKKKGLPYFTSCAEGAKKAAKELGNVELIYDGPTDGSPEKAASMIERWTLQGVDVIAVSPNDPDVLAPAMKKARQKGIKVLTWDADGAKETRDYFINQATYQQIGYALVDEMAKRIAPKGGEPEGEVAIITAYLTAFNQNQWIKYMKEQMAAKYPKMKLIGVKPGQEDQKLAFQVAQDLMKAYPGLKGIWGISSETFPGAAEAVRQAGKSGKIPVLGLSTPNSMRSYVMDDTAPAVILWNTEDLGYLTVCASEALANGTLKPGDKTIKAGGLGEKTIEGDNILLGGILVFTKENIGKYNF